MAARHNPDYDKDFVIVLGAKIRKDGTLTPLLKARVDRAIKFGNEQKENTGKNIIIFSDKKWEKYENEIISDENVYKQYINYVKHSSE